MKVVRREGIESARKSFEREARQTWKTFPGAARFIQDYFPERWTAIQHCSTKTKVWRDRNDATRFKVAPIGCHEVPYCITCTRRRTARRTMAALNDYARCTPHGKLGAYVHLVVSSPYLLDGQGWGHGAHRDPRGFARLVAASAEKAWGPGTGGIYSFQGFGERGFAKPHPHIHATLNGYCLTDNGPRTLPKLDLRGAAFKAWKADIALRATIYDLDAPNWNVNVRVLPRIHGHRVFYPVLRYQLRELVDFRKLEYSRDQHLVWWKSYKTDHRRERIPVGDFLMFLTEYQHRLGAWTKHDDFEGRQILHFRHGIMSDRRINDTEARVGGAAIPHGKRCPCSECGDWDRVFANEDRPGRDAGPDPSRRLRP